MALIKILLLLRLNIMLDWRRFLLLIIRFRLFIRKMIKLGIKEKIRLSHILLLIRNISYKMGNFSSVRGTLLDSSKCLNNQKEFFNLLVVPAIPSLELHQEKFILLVLGSKDNLVTTTIIIMINPK